MSFRRRILIAIAPLFILLVVLGGTGAVLIYHLGSQVEQILRENYDSVIYMRDLNEALERIDSSFQFALAGREEASAEQYRTNWRIFSETIEREHNNITLPGERELNTELAKLRDQYREQGDAFFAHPDSSRQQRYFGQADEKGLYGLFRDIKAVSGNILKINQDNMEESNREARRLARSSLVWYGGLAAVGVGLALLLIVNTIRTIIQPIRAVTASATAIGAGNLDQVVPITSDDELGQLASAFNGMARQLREFHRSQRHQLIRAQHTSQATIDSFPDPVLVVDPQHHVEMANPAARRLLGVLPRDDRTAAVVWQPPERLQQPLADVLHTQREYLPEGFEHTVVLSVGDELHSYLPRILPIRDADHATLGAAILLEDVTRFRLLDEVKSNLVATVSHELKTPLTSIRLVLHLLLEENLGPLSPQQLELIVDARDNAERLLNMINSLLDLARLEQGRSKLNLRPERPATLLRSTWEGFQPQARDQGIELVLEDVGDVPSVAVDAEQFQHAVQNLLNNALAHTPRGGRIALAAERSDGQVAFSITDNGSGIPPEYLPMVFEKYFRVPGDETHGSSGLGLAIVREIVSAHGGTVSCESQPGERTVFRLSLPLWKGPDDQHSSE